MSERLSSKYKKLFEIKILHHYWLDEGDILFDLIADQNHKAKRLQSYDVRTFLAVSPSEATAKTLKAYGCIYNKTTLGFVVAAPESVVIPAETVFEWIVTVTDSAFFNYTALTLQSQNNYRLFNANEKKEYKFKENVAVLSNLTGVTRGAGENKTYFLSQEYSALKADDKVEALVSSGNALNQLINDQPGATAKTIGTQLNNLPVFLHQSDIPNIHPPVGLENVPLRGIYLDNSFPETVFSLIRIYAVRNDTPDFSIVDSMGHAKLHSPVFHIRFKSRSTIWRYLSKTDGALKFEEPEPLPLTYFGNIGTKQKPLAGELLKIEKEGSEGSRITRLLSEIFI